MISSSQRPLPDNTQHSQQTNIHAPGGFRTHDLSRRAAADLRLRPRGHWDRHHVVITTRKAVTVLVAIETVCCRLLDLITRNSSTKTNFTRRAIKEKEARIFSDFTSSLYLRTRIQRNYAILKTMSSCTYDVMLFFLWRCDSTRVMTSSFLRFLDHTQRRTTVGRTPLDERSARRRDLYMTTHTTNIHAPVGIRTHDLSR